MGRRLERELSALEGVHWAAVNHVAARVVVAFDDGRIDLDDIVDVVEAVESAHGYDEERFPHDRPEHPGDEEPLRRQLWALAADGAGIGLGLFTKALQANALSAEAASLISLVEATPALRKPFEDRFGPVADLVLAAGQALAQGMAGGPLGLAVDAAHRALVAREIHARHELWERREPELHGGADPGTPGPLDLPPRPAPLPLGVVERYTNGAAAAAVVAAVAVLAATRDPRLVVSSTVAATPKAARLGREAFAAALGRLLADRGVLSLDPAVLRRLDRVDTVVLDAAALQTGRSVLGSVWVPQERAAEEDAAWLVARTLFDPADPAAAQVADGWRLGPVAAADLPRGDPARTAERALRRSSAAVLGLWDAGGVAALVGVQPELDPMARVVAAAAKDVGLLVVAGVHAATGQHLRADEVVSGGTRIAGHVRALQADGHVVAVVSARQHAALAAADVGIGMHREGGAAPWGAHLVTGRGLVDAWLVLEAVPIARSVSRRSTGFAAYGSGAGGLLALAGPRRGATGRAALGVNAAAAVSVAAGAWSAAALGHRAEPVAEDLTAWHALPAEDALRLVGSREPGLDAAEVDSRTSSPSGGADDGGAPGVLRASLEELANPLTPALASGAWLSAAIGSLTDAGLIGSVMGLNALVGGVQRVGADRALRQLMDDNAVRVTVRRGGTELRTTADRLVTGDVVVLRAGDAVPADCRILEARGIEVDESSLTGESQLVAKTGEPSAAPSVADRTSMLYAGTAVAAGEATALVVATGDTTEVGRSRQRAEGRRRPSGVEARLRRLTVQTVPAALGAGAAIVGGGLLRGRPLSDTLGTGVGLAVAAVPEGLPLVATVAQLAAARRLSRRNALVRHASSTEALGRVDVLCADKTGTLTTGRIHLHSVSDGAANQPLEDLDPFGRAVLAAALRAGPQHADGEHVAHPTDRAVIDGARQAGVDESAGAEGWRPRVELPFEPGRGFHAVLGQVRGGHHLAVKGAPEVILPRCDTWRRPDGPVPLDEAAWKQVQAAVGDLARRGYRVLAVAERSSSGRGQVRDERVTRLELVGLLALGDPVRATAAAAVDGLRAAGVAVLMVTGDHPSTAESIAAELGLLDGKDVLTGADLDAMSDDELGARVDSVSVFARVSPTQKVRIVRALQRAGHVVAMTGDGANDAAAIRLADVGFALGRRATNAAKEAADVVVTDDRIETIIDAIIEGRAMWASVRDAVAVLVGGNLGEIAFTLGTGLLAPGGSPLNARQLLLINLFTDLVPAMALAVRPPHGADPDTLAREGPDASLGTALTRDVLVRGAVTAAAGGIGWYGGRATGVTRSRAGTVALVSIVGSQLGQTLAAGWRSPLVVGSTLASGAALAAVVQTPGVSHFFGCRPLGPLGWAIAGATATGSTLAAPVAQRLLDAVAPFRRG